jgi:hypothetical protein
MSTRSLFSLAAIQFAKGDEVIITSDPAELESAIAINPFLPAGERISKLTLMIDSDTNLEAARQALEPLQEILDITTPQVLIELKVRNTNSAPGTTPPMRRLAL